MSTHKRGMASESIVKIGQEVRRLLEDQGEMYGQQLYAAVYKNLQRKGSYASFRANYLNKLNKLGLIERSHQEPSSNPTFKNRQYWRLTELGRTNSNKWINPQLEVQK